VSNWFDRGVSKGSVARLWVDVIAHIEMAETSGNTASCWTPVTAVPCWRNPTIFLEMAQAVTGLRGAPVGRARARARRRCHGRPLVTEQIVRLDRSRQRWFLLWTFFFGLIAGAAALFLLALLTQPHP